MPLIERVRATRLPAPPRRRAIRLAVGATLKEVAAELGVSQLTVSQWERGKCEPRPEHAIPYRRLLEVLAELAVELGENAPTK
jgi:transcriptional regulator with XRE-family HTH domain